MAQVYRSYGVVSWSPGAGPPKIKYGGRTYLRGGVVAARDMTGYVSLGSAPGGGDILVPPAATGTTPTVLWIRYPDGTVVDYALSGGP